MPGPTDKLALYFGCAKSAGHYLYDATLREVMDHRVPDLPWHLGLMDGGLLKNGGVRDEITGHVRWTCGGRPHLWFAFYWWDRTGDRRTNSNSGFYVRGFEPNRVTRETVHAIAPKAFAFAMESFPSIVLRQEKPLVLVMP